MKRVRVGSPWADSLLLALVVAVSCAPYTGGLGLYSDDWAFLAAMHGADGRFGQLLAAVMPMDLATRPVQGMALAALYRAFQLDPLGYHVFNCAVLIAAVLLFHHSLRRLGVHRVLALTIPLVFGLLPHYSTARFWIAAFQANLSIVLFFLSLFADVRFVTGTGRTRWAWKALGTVALAGSLLAYEVTAVLALLTVAVLLVLIRLRAGDGWPRTAAPIALGIASNVLVLAAAVAYKLTTTVRADLAGGYRYRALRILTEAVPVHFGEYGLALPVRVVQALGRGPDAVAVAASLFVGVLVGFYLHRTLRSWEQPLGGVRWPAVVAFGGVVFVAGYGVALMTWEVGFHATGANNRTAAGAAIGVAWVFVGLAGWVSARLLPHTLRRAGFAALIALLAGAGTLLTNTVASFWVRAVRQQEDLIDRIQQRFPALPPGTALLLDGVCPFVGPAPVFATGWDTAGMLRIVYEDETLQGDVVKPNTEATPDGLRTLLFDDVINLYPYSPDLHVFHARSGRAYTLDTREAARDYLAGPGGDSPPGCPPYSDGDGAPIF